MKKAFDLIKVLACVFCGLPCVWGASIWTGPGSDFNTGTNWSAGVPTDNAIFNSAAPTTVGVSASANLTEFTFNAGAASYNFSLPNAVTLTVQPVANSMSTNSGIFNNSTASQTFDVLGGGALTFQGSSSAGNAVLHNAGTLTFGTTFNGVGIAGATAGSASIVNTGTLIFSGASDGGNASIINEGTMQLVRNQPLTASEPSLMNATITNNGVLDASNLTGIWLVGSIDGAGTIINGSGNNNPDLYIGNNNQSMVISGAITGTGNLRKFGTGTLTLAGANTYTGNTTLSFGELRILGSLMSNVTVAPQTILSGTGRVATITNQGGEVSPGTHTPGQLTSSNYSGSGIVRILMDGSSASSLKVIGNANITGSTLTITGTSFAVGQYRVLESDILTGSFAGINTPSSLLSFLPLYSRTDVIIRIGFATPFLSIAQSSNQRNLAAQLNTFQTTTPQFTTAITQLEELPTEQISNAFNAISGDSLASFQTFNLQNATAFGQGMRQRSVNVSSGSYGLWAQGMGWTESVDGDSSIGSPEMQANTGGFQVGYDYALFDNWVVGISGGYGHTSLDVSDRSSSGDTTSILSGFYTGYALDNWFAHASSSLTSGSNHMTRSIRYGSVDAQAASHFPSRVLSTVVEGGYSFYPKRSLTIAPSVSLLDQHLHQDAFTESGGSGLDLNAADQTVHSLTSSLGAGFKYTFNSEAANSGFVTFTTAWQYELSQNENALSLRFSETSGGDYYMVRATPRNRNAAALGLQAEVPLNGSLALFAHYTATVATMQTAQTLNGGARLRW